MNSIQRSSIGICTAALIVIVLLGCSAGENNPGTEIIVYGSPACSLCNALKADLESRSIAYTFADISADRDALVELSRNIADESWFDGTIEMPIVSVDETYLRRPTVDEIRAILSN